MRSLLAHLLPLCLALLLGAEGTADPPDRKESRDRGGEDRPRVTLRLGAADAAGIPGEDHHARTGGGNFVVRQPSPDTLIITMTGLARAQGSPLAVSAADFRFDLRQCFTVVFDSPEVRSASLQIQGYAMGLLRSPCKGTASFARACCALTCDGAGPRAEIAGFCLPARSVGPGENLSLYCRSERLWVPVVPACYTLHQTFAIAAAEPKCGFPGHGSSADFSTKEDQRVDFGHRRDPFEGVSRRDFGFHVIVHVVPDDMPAAGRTSPAAATLPPPISSCLIERPIPLP